MASSWTTVKIGVPALAVALGFLFLVFMAPSCNGFEDDTVRLVNACPQATKVLGGTVERRKYGLQTGSSSRKRSGGNQWAKQDVLVRGPSGDGVVSVDAMYHSGVWTIRTALLHAGGEAIEVTRCGTQTPARLVGTRRFSGRVTGRTGAAPVGDADLCELSVESKNDGELCRAVITCAGKAVYGAKDTLGFNLCGYVATGASTKALVILDEDRRLGRNEPTLRYDERTRIAKLESEQAGAWSATLTLR